MSYLPNQFLLFPMPSLTGESNIVRSVSGTDGGISPGRIVPDVDNKGAASAFSTGAYRLDQYSLTRFRIRCFDSGANYSGGTWGWQKEGDPRVVSQTITQEIKSKDSSESNTFNITSYKVEGGYKGYNDYRYLHSFSTAVWSANKGASTTCGFLKKSHRECWFNLNPSTDRIDVRYRNTATSSYKSWTKTGCNFYTDQPEDGASPVGPDSAPAPNPWVRYDYGARNYTSFAVCDLDDDTLMAAMSVGDDIWIWESTDGVNWYLRAKNILSRFAKRTMRLPKRAYQVKMARSGSYFRILFLDFSMEYLASPSGAMPSVLSSGAPGESFTTAGEEFGDEWCLRSLVSSDRGATWKETSYQDIPVEVQTFFGASDQASEALPFDLGGCDDAAGTFVMTLFQSVETTSSGSFGGSGSTYTQNILTTYTASTMTEWQLQPMMDMGRQEADSDARGIVRSLWFVRGPHFLHLFTCIEQDLSYLPYPGLVSLYGTRRNAGYTIEQILIDPYNATNYTGWNNMFGGNYGCTLGCPPAFATGLSNGEWVACGGGRRYGRGSTLKGDMTPGGFYFRVGGWDQFPMSDRLSPQYLPNVATNGSWQPSYRGVRGWKADGSGYTLMDAPQRIGWAACLGDPVRSARSEGETFWTQSGGWSDAAVPIGTYYGRNAERFFITTNSRSSSGYLTCSTAHALDSTEAPSTENRSYACIQHKGGHIAQPAGSVLEFTMRMRNGSVSGGDVYVEVQSRDFQVGMDVAPVYVKARIKFQAPSTDPDENTTGKLGGRTYQGVIALSDENKGGSWDEKIVAGIPVDTFNEYWTVRLVFMPILNTDQLTMRYVKCRLMARKYGTDYWTISDVPITDNTDGATSAFMSYKGLQPLMGTAGSIGEQHVQWGHGINQVTGMAGKDTTTSWWKQMQLWSPSDMQQYFWIKDKPDLTHYQDQPWIYPRDLRGQIFASDPCLMDNGVSVNWGAIGAVEGDKWLLSPEYQYPAQNLFQPSPRVKWQSEEDAAVFSHSDHTIVLKADTNNDNASFDCDAIALFGTNFRSASIAFASNTAFTADVISGGYNFAKYGDSSFKLRVNTQGGNILYLDDGQNLPYDGELIDGGSGRMGMTTGKRAWIYLSDGTGSEEYGMWEVIRQVGTTCIHINNPSASFSIPAGSSVEIVVDRAVVFPTTKPDSRHKYMRIQMFGKTNERNYQIGSLVVGTTMNLSNFPMEWNYTDNAQPNITHYRTKGAVKWGFVEGPPQRTVSGQFVGDITQTRDRIRAMLNQTASYSRIPVVFGFDSEVEAAGSNTISGHDRFMLGWVTSGGKLDNTAWYKDSRGIWRNAGDMSIDLEECV